MSNRYDDQLIARHAKHHALREPPQYHAAGSIEIGKEAVGCLGRFADRSPNLVQKPTGLQYALTTIPSICVADFVGSGSIGPDSKRHERSVTLRSNSSNESGTDWPLSISARRRRISSAQAASISSGESSSSSSRLSMRRAA